MRNLWIQMEHPFATWVADLTLLQDRPCELLDVVLALLTSGAHHRVFVPVALPALGFERARDGEPSRMLRELWDQHRVVDALGFTGAAMAPGAPGSSTVEAELAWFDRGDAIVTGRVTDLGAVLRELEPVPGSIGEGFTVPFAPVRITGRRLIYEGAAPADAGRPIEIRIAVHSDIWMPYVFGSAHPLADHKRHFDNRPLAGIHTPRLNGFLRDVADVVGSAGGGWHVDLDETSTDARRWLDARGIHLDAEPPALFPPEAYDAEWF